MPKTAAVAASNARGAAGAATPISKLKGARSAVRSGRNASLLQGSDRLRLNTNEDILPDALLTFQDAFEEGEPWSRDVQRASRRNFMTLSFVLNVLTLLTGYLAFRAVFCNSAACEYVGPNTICEAVSIDDAECTTHPDACNCGSGAVQKGNGFCNVENNNCACGWDGGDCCIPNMPVGQCDGDTTTADLCDCQDPDFDFPCNGACGVGPQKGDSMCDDSNNNCGCDWDGGDCCFSSVSCAYCGERDCDYRFKHFFESCETLLADEGCTCDGCSSCFDDPNKFSRCLDCQCLDPLYSVRANNYSYHSDFIELYRNNETYESYTREEVCGGIPESTFLVADYDWPEACECPCAYARYWYVNFGWVIVFALVYFIYILESILLHTVAKVKNPAIRNCVDRIVTTHFLYTMKVNFKTSGDSYMRQLRSMVPSVKLVIASYKSEQHYKLGRKPVKIAGVAFKFTKWRDITPDLERGSSKKFIRLQLTPRLAFDGYSTLRQFQNLRKKLLEKHVNPEAYYQVYTENFDIPKFSRRTFRVKGGGIFLSSPFYLAFTIAGLSWFYRLFIELGSTEYILPVTKLVSLNAVKKDDQDWKVIGGATASRAKSPSRASQRTSSADGRFLKSTQVLPVHDEPTRTPTSGSKKNIVSGATLEV